MSAADGEYENRINHSTDAQASDLQAQTGFFGRRICKVAAWLVVTQSERKQ